MPDAPGEQTPALRRLELAAALRRHRKLARLTTADVTARLGFSTSKLSRLETGNRPIQLPDLDALCHLYDVDIDERARLSRLAGESRQSSMWQQHESLDSEEAEYSELEQAASAIDDYKTSIVTGLLQIPAYTEALIRRLHPHLPAHVIAGSVEARGLRQTKILERPTSPELRFLMDEGVLRRLVGGTSVMRSQLDHLARLSERHRLSIRVIPFTHGAHPGMDSLFTVLSFREGVRDRVYIDGLMGSTYLVNAKDLQRYRATIEQLNGLALDQEQSRQAIATAAKALSD